MLAARQSCDGAERAIQNSPPCEPQLSGLKGRAMKAQGAALGDQYPCRKLALKGRANEGQYARPGDLQSLKDKVDQPNRKYHPRLLASGCRRRRLLPLSKPAMKAVPRKR